MSDAKNFFPSPADIPIRGLNKLQRIVASLLGCFGTDEITGTTLREPAPGVEAWSSLRATADAVADVTFIDPVTNSSITQTGLAIPSGSTLLGYFTAVTPASGSLVATCIGGPPTNSGPYPKIGQGTVIPNAASFAIHHGGTGQTYDVTVVSSPEGFPSIVPDTAKVELWRKIGSGAYSLVDTLDSIAGVLQSIAGAFYDDLAVGTINQVVTYKARYLLEGSSPGVLSQVGAFGPEFAVTLVV